MHIIRRNLLISVAAAALALAMPAHAKISMPAQSHVRKLALIDRALSAGERLRFDLLEQARMLGVDKVLAPNETSLRSALASFIVEKGAVFQWNMVRYVVAIHDHLQKLAPGDIEAQLKILEQPQLTWDTDFLTGREMMLNSYLSLRYLTMLLKLDIEPHSSDDMEAFG